MKTLLTMLLLTLTGCAAFDTERTPPMYSEVSARVILTDDLPANINANAVWDGSVCTIHIKSRQYPYCMTHELRHCFEHDWHKDRASTEDCMTQ